MSLETVYQIPPKEIVDVVEAPLMPAISIDPKREWMLLMGQSQLPSIEEVAQPELRLAGLRFDPKACGPSRTSHYTNQVLKRMADGQERAVTGLPEGGRLGGAQWSPDGSRYAFTVRDQEGITLWMVDVETCVARQVTGLRLNQILGSGFAWLSDSQRFILQTLVEDRGELPEAPGVPKGPTIQENVGKVAPSRTYQDLLKNVYDEACFEYYLTSQLVVVDRNGEARPIGEAGMVGRAEPAPGGQYVLVETLQRPFSYLVPYNRFPRSVAVWDLHGQVVRNLADLPLAEEIPIGFDAVPKGPRSFGWRADHAASLAWVEAQDGGDPHQEAAVRDRVYLLSEPFEGDPSPLISLASRYAGRVWGTGDLALVSERWWKTRNLKTWRICPDHPERDPQILFDRSWEDRYGDPGTPLTKRTLRGTRVLLTGKDGDSLFLVGDGASPEGDRPFLDRLCLGSKETERLMQSEAPSYERPVTMVADGVVLMSRESVEEPTNYYLRDLEMGNMQQVTHFVHPMPWLKEVQKELIQYRRSDGVQLMANLYLPPGYTISDGPLPMVMWAYPRSFKSADAAGQVNDSPYRFVRIRPREMLPFLTQGYAILDGPTMPIVEEGVAEANDTYVAQLVASAEAAVDEVVRRGVAE
ncbi:MAG: S9 family peptidase, partial [bacterium]|nr:S9 family peptidase [bacterium]